MTIKTEEKHKTIKEFGISEDDTGSTQVQVALLSRDIISLTTHLKEHPKDFSSKKGLIKMVSRRRRLLRYLERADVLKYKELIRRLDLRK